MAADQKRTEFFPDANNLAFVEGLYEEYLRAPASVAPEWQRYFAGLTDSQVTFAKPRIGPSFRPFSIFNPPSASNGSTNGVQPPSETAALQDRVYLLIRLYRVRGHRIAQVDPLGLPQPVPPELQPEFFGFTEADMQ